MGLSLRQAAARTLLCVCKKVRKPLRERVVGIIGIHSQKSHSKVLHVRERGLFSPLLRFKQAGATTGGRSDTSLRARGFRASAERPGKAVPCGAAGKGGLPQGDGASLLSRRCEVEFVQRPWCACWLRCHSSWEQPWFQGPAAPVTVSPQGASAHCSHHL